MHLARSFGARQNPSSAVAAPGGFFRAAFTGPGTAFNEFPDAPLEYGLAGGVVSLAVDDKKFFKSPGPGLVEKTLQRLPCLVTGEAVDVDNRVWFLGVQAAALFRPAGPGLFRVRVFVVDSVAAQPDVQGMGPGFRNRPGNRLDRLPPVCPRIAPFPLIQNVPKIHYCRTLYQVFVRRSAAQGQYT